MKKSHVLKQQEIETIKERFQKAHGVVAVRYSGITVGEITSLRVKFRNAGVDYVVLKNTLVRRALDELGIKDLDHILEGPSAFAFGMNDPISPAKIVLEFINQSKSDKMKIKAGLAEGQYLDPAGVQALAKLPSREVLISRMLSSLNAPASSLVGVLSATLGSLVYTLEAIRKQKAGE